MSTLKKHSVRESKRYSNSSKRNSLFLPHSLFFSLQDLGLSPMSAITWLLTFFDLDLHAAFTGNKKHSGAQNNYILGHILLCMSRNATVSPLAALSHK